MFQNRYVCLVVVSKFSISSVGNPISFALVPDKTVFIVSNHPGSFPIVIATAAAIASRPVLF